MKGQKLKKIKIKRQQNILIKKKKFVLEYCSLEALDTNGLSLNDFRVSVGHSSLW